MFVILYMNEPGARCAMLCVQKSSDRSMGRVRRREES
jgi:hypothetical protein